MKKERQPAALSKEKILRMARHHDYLIATGRKIIARLP